MPRNTKQTAGKVTRRSDGRYMGTLQINGVRRSVYGKSEKEVRAALKALQQQVAQSGRLADPGSRTLADLTEAWLTSAPGLKETTKASYRNFLTLYAFPAFGDDQLDRITPDRVQRLYASLKPSVAEKLHRILHRAFAVAVMWRWLDDNPCNRVMRPAYRPAERQLWSNAEAQAFVSGIDGHWLGPLYLLIMATGLRLGEALALGWDDVGLGVAVSVNGTLQHLNGETFVGEPKTANAKRTVLLPSLAVAALQRQKTQQDGWRDVSHDDWPVEPLVFTGETGKPLHRCVPEAALRRLCARLNLPPVTPHGLRHLHASLLIDEGVPITAVSARLGHANPQITLRLYAHALPGQDKAAAEAIGRALASAETMHNPGPQNSAGGAGDE